MNNLFINFKDLIPTDSYYFMQEKLNNISDEKAKNLTMLNLKSPTIGLVLGLLLGVFGVDRFYKGDVLLGILKLITLGGFYVWAIVDLYFVWQGIKKDNLEKLNLVL